MSIISGYYFRKNPVQAPFFNLKNGSAAARYWLNLITSRQK
jgi:hypothetical protein